MDDWGTSGNIHSFIKKNYSISITTTLDIIPYNVIYSKYVSGYN